MALTAAAKDYKTSLDDLTFNSKPHINALTMLAEENADEARAIVRVIEEKLDKALPNCKLPIMYLMDSIVKNVGGNYKPLFAQNIVKTFLSTFQQGGDKIKMSLYKLRSTWDNYLPLKRLYDLDVAVQGIDSNWPVKPLPASLQEKASTSIHVNPKFLKNDNISTPTSRISSSKTTVVSDGSDLKQDLINKQKQLLELQQQKLLLELEQTKQQLALREKKTLDKKQGKVVSKDPRVKQGSKVRPGMRGSTNGLVDPRVALSATKSKNDTKKVPVELNPKQPDVTKSDVPKAAEKKVSNSKKSEKKKSPNSSNKTPVTKVTKSPKSPKTDLTVKKTSTKKSTGKAVKRSSPESKLDEPVMKSKKTKDKPARSPLLPHPPPKQSRPSSIERRPSPHAEINHAAGRPRGRPLPQKDIDSRRYSPMSREDSMSPRFSPEPEDSPGRNHWGPAEKRRRRQDITRLLHPHIPPSHEPPRFQRRTSVDPNLTIPQELTLSHQAEIMKQADIQLQKGHLTHTQHQELLKQLHQLFQLQRLRNSVGPGTEMHRMPLDELLPVPPEHRDRNEEYRPRMYFQEDLNYRPLPSPPMMGDDPRLARPIREHNLTPPPNPPFDPRRNRDRNGDNRLMRERDYRDPRPRILNEPGRRRSPPHNGGWDENNRMQRRDISTDMDNIYVMEDDQESPGPHENDQNMHNLNSGTRPSDGVPLQAYAENHTAHVRSLSFDSNSSPDNHNDAIKEQSEPQAKVDSDNEYNGPQFEEPEDYIIANIPPGAEAYHEHSMKLKGGNKVAASMIASRKLSDAGKEQESSNDKATTSESRDSVPMSPDSSRDKLDDADDLTKSPSLPLKKRKYMVSPGRVDDADTSNEQGSEVCVKVEDSSNEPQKTMPDVEHHSVISEVKIKTEKTDDFLAEPEKTDNDKTEQPVHDKSLADQEEKVTTKDPANIDIVVEKPDESKDNGAGTSKKRVKSEEVGQSSQSQKKDKTRVRPLLSNANSEPIAKKKRKREKLKERKPAQVQPPLRMPPSEKNIVLMEEERRLNQLMMEEEERLRWEAQLEMELGREEFQERERFGRPIRPPSPPHMMWPRGEGPWRGRGMHPPPGRERNPLPGRERRFEREFWDKGPPSHFPERIPLTRPPPPRRLIDEREWNRREEQRHDRPPMLRPPPGRDWPPRPLPRGPSPNRVIPEAPERSQPPADLNQVNVNKLLSDLLSMGIIPGQSKTNNAEKPAETPVDTKPLPETSNNHRVEVPNVPSLAIKNEKRLEENRVPTPVFDDLLTIDPNANLPDLELRDTDKLKIRDEDVVARLYTGIQCSACGMRFTACQTDMYAEHLDWHYRLNRKDKEGIRETHRELYPSAGEWIMYEEIVDPSRREKNQAFDGEEEPVEDEVVDQVKDETELAVPVAKNPEQDKCAVCREAFTTIYNDEEEEWQYINCVAVDGKNFHPACFADHSEPTDETAPPPTPVRVPIYNPLSVATSGIPGLDSLAEMVPIDDVADDTKNMQMETDENSTVESKQEIDADFANEVQESEQQAVSPPHSTVSNSDEVVDNGEIPASTTGDENDSAHETKDIEDVVEAQDIVEKSSSPVRDNFAADIGIKSVDSPKTQILDKVESHSPLTTAADDANEILHETKIVDAPVDGNDSVQMQAESSSSPDADSIRDADRSSGSTVGQQQEPRAPEIEVGGSKETPVIADVI